MNFIKRLTKDTLFNLLILGSLFNFVLLLIRIYWSSLEHSFNTSAYLFLKGGNLTYLFLIWNLFLAWIPFIVATYIRDNIANPKKQIFLFSLLSVCWILFLPNAPYIVTDLLHLKPKPGVPHWYDLLLIFSFAWTGLMLGFASVFRLQKYISRHFSNATSTIFVFIVFWLTGFGVYIGRFQRWNSWDIIARPMDLVKDIFNVFLQPENQMPTLGMAFILPILLTISYFTLLSFSKEQETTALDQ